ncbi:hypothetical protein OIV83_000998 [Microbotryomycetes sp. JL201]|nr:hypothetical protein OIV83_000998 [Microbotryomycetes sp. JL201]
MAENPPSSDPNALYYVDSILDYKLEQRYNDPESLDFDPTLGPVQWQVVYLVHWQGWASEADSWEPLSCFSQWTPGNERDIASLRRQDPTRKSVEELEREAKSRNDAERSKLLAGKTKTKAKKRKREAEPADGSKRTQLSTPTSPSTDANAVASTWKLAPSTASLSRSVTPAQAAELSKPLSSITRQRDSLTERPEKASAPSLSAQTRAMAQRASASFADSHSPPPLTLVNQPIIEISGFLDEENEGDYEGFADEEEEDDQNIAPAHVSIQQATAVRALQDSTELEPKLQHNCTTLLLPEEPHKHSQRSPFADSESDDDDDWIAPLVRTSAAPSQQSLTSAVARMPSSRSPMHPATTFEKELEQISTPPQNESADVTPSQKSKQASITSQESSVSPSTSRTRSEKRGPATLRKDTAVPKLTANDNALVSASAKPKSSTDLREGTSSMSPKAEAETLLLEAGSEDRAGRTSSTSRARKQGEKAKNSSAVDDSKNQSVASRKHKAQAAQGKKKGESATNKLVKQATDRQEEHGVTAKSRKSKAFGQARPAKRKRAIHVIADSEEDDSAESSPAEKSATTREESSGDSRLDLQRIGRIPKKFKPDAPTKTTVPVPSLAFVDSSEPDATAISRDTSIGSSSRHISSHRESSAESSIRSRPADPRTYHRSRRSDSPAPQTPFDIKLGTPFVSRLSFSSSPQREEQEITSSHDNEDVGTRKSSDKEVLPPPDPTQASDTAKIVQGTKEVSSSAIDALRAHALDSTALPVDLLDTPPAPPPETMLPVSTSRGSATNAGVPPQRTLGNDDPWNKGFARPRASNGFVDLRTEILEQNLKRNGFLREWGGGSRDMSVVNRIRMIFGVGDWRENYHDFDQVMQTGPDGNSRQAWIYAPRKDQPFNKKQARAVEGDYIALQLLLSSIAGVKQSDSLRDAVTAVFVHASEMANIGKARDGDLAKLDAFRSRSPKHTVFIIFGEFDDGRPRRRTQTLTFRRFWQFAATVTFTPEALKQSPRRLQTLIQEWSKCCTSRRNQSVSVWIPCTYLFPGGPFDCGFSGYLPLAVWNLVNSRRISLLNTLLKPHTETEWALGFPHIATKLMPDKRLIKAWSHNYPHQLPNNMTGYLSGLAHSQNSFLNFRQWIVIKADLEKTPEPEFGIEVLTINEAAARLAQPDISG